MKQIELTDEQYTELLTMVQCEIDDVLDKIDKLKGNNRLNAIEGWNDELEIILNMLNGLENCRELTIKSLIDRVTPN